MDTRNQAAKGAWIVAAMLGMAGLAAAEGETFRADARGFGPVEATLRYPGGRRDVSWTTFAAADAARARVVASKRLADLLGFGGIALAPEIRLPGTALRLEGAAVWLLGVRGADVHELCAPDEAALRRLAAAAGADGWEAPEAGVHPRWLDGFDNAGPAVWVGGAGEQYVLPSDFEWLRDRRLAMVTLSPSLSRLAGPGLLDTTIFDWHSAMAAKYQIPYRTLFFPATHAWMWNRYPLPYARPYPGHVASTWLEYLANTADGAYEPVPIKDRYDDDARRMLAQRLLDDPLYIGMHGCTEIPDAGIMQLAVVANDPGIKALWHGYLSAHLGMSLDTVGLLHKGDSRAYASWEEVRAPLPMDFLGWDPATCLDLRGVWRMRLDAERAGVAQSWFDPSTPQDGWVEGDANDPMILIHAPTRRPVADLPYFWMRRAFRVAAGDVARLAYLHIARAEHHGTMTPLFDVWLNGVKLEPLSDERGDFSMCYPLGGALRAGDNEMVLNTRGAPIPGYCFLGEMPLRRYPRMTRPENRRWFDAVNFSAWLRVSRIEGQLLATRAVDPNRPLKMMATINLLDMTTRLAKQYGAYQHDTGGGAAYWAPMTGARLARTHGLPWSSEQGEPPRTAAEFQGHITRYILYGNDAVNLVFNVGHYRDRPEVAAWFDQNLDLIHCIGKMRLPTPPIAVLRSTRATRLGFLEPWDWDVGRGALQAVGRNFSYLEVPDLHDGVVDRFPVVMDAGTVLMTEEDVAAILRYVERGGVFVAQHHTGRHLPEAADAWPLARALGLTVSPRWMSDENFHRWVDAEVEFDGAQTLLPSLRGQTIHVSGVALDGQGAGKAGGMSFAVAGGAVGEIRPVARWKQDGSMAVAEARLGRGRLILLGSIFFTRMRDASGAWTSEEERSRLLDELLAGLDVPRDSWTGNRDIWAEIWRSKNGVFDLYLTARNTTQGEQSAQAAIRFRREDRIGEIVEVSAARHPRRPVSWEDGIMTLPATALTHMESRIYAAPRAEIGRSGLEWFQTQSKIWHALPPVPSARLPQPVEMPDTMLALKDGWTLKVEGQPDREVRIGAFGALGLPERTVAVFERQVAIPASWQGRRIELVFDAEYWFWGILPHGTLTVNGVQAPIPHPIRPSPLPGFSCDVTAAAAGGTLRLRLEIDGVNHGGITRGQEEAFSKPHGVNGLFYLKATAPPIKSEPLPGAWFAASAYNHLQPTQPGAAVDCVYLEARFTLPAEWPAQRLFLEAPVHLGFLVLNGTVLTTPAWMRRLDISRLARRDGSENVLRWVPEHRHVPHWDRRHTVTVPALNLAWIVSG